MLFLYDSKHGEAFKSVAMKSQKIRENNAGHYFAYIDSNRNRFSEWAVGFRYGNFFIPRVVKNLKISPWEGKTYLPRAYGFFQPLG